MVRLLKDESLVASWMAFFENDCKSEIETVAQSYPEKRSLFVDWEKIDKANSELAESLINEPYKALFNAEEALKNIDVATLQHGKKMLLHFRVINLPEIATVPIRKINPVHAGKLIAVDGIIKRRMPVKAKLQVAAFQCQKCGAIIKIEQDEDILKEPSECYEDQGGCGRISSFKLLMNQSTVIPFQKIELQEEPETVGAIQPQKIPIHFEDDITSTDHLNPGDRIRVVGILHTVQKRRGPLRLTIFDFMLDAYSYQSKETTYEDIELTDEDIKGIEKASKDPLIFDNLRLSIAPSLYGLHDEKDGIVLQLFSGPGRFLADGTWVRRDIHILLAGDPGTAKSQLLSYASKVAPRGVFVEGPSSTGAGLTATAVKDEFSDGQWVLEAGALPLADLGMVCVDEMDKMEDNDRNKIHRGMEQQEIAIAKAGIIADLKCRCSVLAAANPKEGRFIGRPTLDQIDLPTTLLTRFDLMFAVVDKPDEIQDTELATHILTASKTGADKPHFPQEFIRKYIAYAKGNIFPEIDSDDVVDVFRDYFVSLRNSLRNKQSDIDSDTLVPISPRQLEALIRLATASARIRLSKEVSVEDAERAVKMFNGFVQRLCIDQETGLVNWDIVTTGISYSQRGRMRTVVDIISGLCGDNLEASPEAIISECEIKGIPREKTEDAIKRLEQHKQIFKTPQGQYKINP